MSIDGFPLSNSYLSLAITNALDSRMAYWLPANWAGDTGKGFMPFCVILRDSLGPGGEVVVEVINLHQSIPSIAWDMS